MDLSQYQSRVFPLTYVLSWGTDFLVEDAQTDKCLVLLDQKSFLGQQMVTGEVTVNVTLQATKRVPQIGGVGSSAKRKRVGRLSTPPPAKSCLLWPSSSQRHSQRISSIEEKTLFEENSLKQYSLENNIYGRGAAFGKALFLVPSQKQKQNF